METTKKYSDALQSVMDKISDNRIQAWEDQLEDTKAVVIIEDFSKNCDSNDPELEFKYNGWVEDLQELLNNLKANGL